MPKPPHQSSPGKFAEIAPAIPLSPKSPQQYTYHLPKDLAKSITPYSKVSIPLGKRVVTGVVLAIHNKARRFTKPVQGTTPLTLTKGQIALAEKISLTMQGGLGYTLRLFFPRSSRLPASITTPLPPLPSSAPTEQKKKHSGLASGNYQLIERDDARRAELIAIRARQLVGQQQGLIIIPEIWRSAHLRQALRKYFGDTAAELHSAVSIKEEAAIWHGVKAGSIRIVVGTQTSLFLPWQKLKVIFLDDEFFSTHKLRQAYPRLDNRYGARWLATIHDCPLIYAGSTPSLALYHADQQQQLVTLHNNPLKNITKLVSPTFEDRQQHNLLPHQFTQQLTSWLKAKQRVFILLNRKGYWSTVYCKSCLNTLRCSQCGNGFLVKKRASRGHFTCRSCGEAHVTEACPTCGKQLTTFGPGAERVADVLSKLYPKVEVVQISASLTKKRAAPEVWPKAKSTLIIGTTAALPAAATVGVDQAVFLWPEATMRFPDFRSEERALSILARLQLLLPARRPVTIVTNQHRLIAERLTGQYQQLHSQQLAERRQFNKPPVTDLVRLTFTARTMAAANQQATALRQSIAKHHHQDIWCQGPYESLTGKRGAKAESHLLIAGSLPQLVTLYDRAGADRVDLAPEKIL